MPNVPSHLYKIFRKYFPLICTDGIVVHERHVLLVRRQIDPFKGYWTLPGGHIDYGESSEEAVQREVLEETGIVTQVIGLIDVFSKPDRDPMGHIISIVYLLKFDEKSHEVVGFDLNEVRDVRWFPIHRLPDHLGFDHAEMIRAAQLKYPQIFP